MKGLRQRLEQPVDPVESIGLNGDMLEAQAFGYLAARVVNNLSLSSPTTTGCVRPIKGGIISDP
jgi:anhydro-N-acetylmuramic acid kinase